MSNDNQKRGKWAPVATGKLTSFADGGSAQVIFSYTGYPILKKITLSPELQKRWQEAVTAYDMSLDMPDFLGVFCRYESGRELIRSLKATAAAKEGDCLGVHVVGLPKDQAGRDRTMEFMQKAMGVVYFGGATEMKPNLHDQDLHKDEGSVRGMPSAFVTADAIVLYPKTMKENNIPTVVATNEEVMWAAARAESAFRQSQPETGSLELPAIDAPVEQKFDWLKQQMSEGSYMFFTDREVNGGVNYIDQHKPNQTEFDKAEKAYIENLFREACKAHDFTTPVYVQEGEALVMNNRAMYHARGEGPQNAVGERVYMRAMVARNMLPTDALERATSNEGRY